MATPSPITDAAAALNTFNQRLADMNTHKAAADANGRKKKPNPEQEKLAMVLAAIEDVVKSRKPAQAEGSTFTMTPTECFAATMTCIEASKGEHLCELFNLLSITLPAVPRPVLVAKWQVMSDALFQMTKVAAQVELAEANEGRASSRLSRWLVASISAFLKATLLIDGETTKSALSRLYDLLLSSTVDPRPKVRRTAQDGLIAILEASRKTPRSSQAALGYSFNFFCRVLKDSCLKFGKPADARSEAITLDTTGMLQLLGFFKRYLPMVPLSKMSPICKITLAVPSLGQPTLTNAALHAMEPVLKSTVAHTPRASAADKQAIVNVLELIVRSTVEMQPDCREVLPMQAFCELITQSFALLYKAHHLGAVLLLPKLVDNMCTALKTARHVAVLDALSKAGSAVFTCFLSKATWRQHAEYVASGASSDGAPPTSRAIASVFQFITDPAYMPVWAFVLPILTAVLKAIQPLANASAGSRKYSDPVLIPIAARAAQVYEAVHSADAADMEQSRSNRIALKNLGAVLAQSVSCVGIENFMSVCPLKGGLGIAGANPKSTSKPTAIAHSREWVLKFLSDNLSTISRKPISFFQEYFVPVARECSVLEQSKREAGELNWAKHYHMLTFRVWALLPAYLTHPLETSDVVASFPKLAPLMYGAAKDQKHPELSPIVCQALVTVISPYVQNSIVTQEDSTEDTNAEPVKVLPPEELAAAQAMFQRFAPKFVPLLFKQYEQQHGKWEGTEVEPSVVAGAPVPPPMPVTSSQIPAGGIGEGGSAERLAALLEAATKYASIAGASLVQKFATTLLSRLAKAQLPPSVEELQANPGKSLENVRQTCILLGLSQALIPSVSRDKLSLIFRALKMILGNGPPALIQTRCFAAVECICRREQSHSVSADGKVDPLLADLASLLQDALVSVAPKAKRRRLRCLRLLIDRGGIAMLAKSAAARAANKESDGGISDDEDDDEDQSNSGQPKLDEGKAWLVGLIGEIVLCTKESNSKAREAAFELLTAIGHSALKEGGQAGFVDLLTMVSAALAGRTPHMKSAGVIALSRLFYEFRSEAAMQMHAVNMLRTVLLLMREKSREVVKSVIGFIKVAVSALPHETLQQELPHVVQSLMLWAGESKNRFRLKIKAIFERLVQKFGGETIVNLVPVSDRPLITHIVKMKERSRVHAANEKKARQHQTGGPNSTKAAVEAAVRAQFSRKRRARVGEEQESDSDADDDTDGAVAKRGRRTGKSDERISSKQYIRDDNGANADDMDLLNTAQMARRLRTSQPNVARRGGKVDEDGFAISLDGKLIVPDDRKNRGGNSDDEDGPESALGSWTKESRQTGGVRGASRILAAKKRMERQAGRSNKHAGDRFKAKNAKGDVKKTGSLEPYAYIRLDAKATTKKGRKDNLAKFSKHRNPKAGKSRKRSR